MQCLINPNEKSTSSTHVCKCDVFVEETNFFFPQSAVAPDANHTEAPSLSNAIVHDLYQKV